MPADATDDGVITVASEDAPGEREHIDSIMSDGTTSPASASGSASPSPTSPPPGPPPTSQTAKKNPRKRPAPTHPPVSELRYPRRRSAKACGLCRARKTKCDNVHPVCGFCLSVGANCAYGDSTSSYPSFDPASTEILRTLNQLVDSQQELLEVIRSSNAARAEAAAPPPPLHATPTTAASFVPHARGLRRPWEDQDDAHVPWTPSAAVPEPTRPVAPTSRITSCQGSNHSQAPSTPFVPTRSQEPPLPATFAATSPGSVLLAEHGNPGALRWLGLLADDAAGREVSFLGQVEEETSRELLDVGSIQDGTALQKATRIVDGSPDAIEASTYLMSFGEGEGDAGAQISSRGMSERQLWQARDAIQLLPSETVLFENFVQQISLWIDLFDPRRHFSSVVPRLALHNAGLMNAILALSCQYNSLGDDMVTSPESLHANDALQFYYQALHYVQKAMRYPSYQSSRELITTTLIISMYEMLAGSQKDWERHLQGVFFILKSQDTNVEIESLESAVWWAWLRQDMWAAFRNRGKTHTAWTPKKPYAAMGPYEMASRSVWQLAQVINYCSPDPFGPSDPSKLCEKLERGEQLLRMLDEWQSHLTVEFDPLPASASTESPVGAFRPLLIYPPCYGLAVQAHYVARILLSSHGPIFGGVTGYLDRVKSLSSWIHIVCGVGMTLTDVASGIMSSQYMFIAGMFTQDRHERECILQLLDGCRRRTRWPAKPLEDELTEIWQTSTAPKGGPAGLGKSHLFQEDRGFE